MMQGRMSLPFSIFLPCAQTTKRYSSKWEAESNEKEKQLGRIGKEGWSGTRKEVYVRICNATVGGDASLSEAGGAGSRRANFRPK